MDASQRIENALQHALLHARSMDGPPLLQQALGYAVFPGGARVRPRLALAVAAACGGGSLRLADASAAAIELLHCASLVHDDLPCFDDASLRRGKPSVHTAFGERIAVLTGDALIVLAFEALALGACDHPQRLQQVLRIVAAGVGSPHGIVAGQAWECEDAIDLARYQQAKTGALFAAATMAGAAAAGSEHRPWSHLGACLGEAYQVADDLQDVLACADECGKPVGQDLAHDRPSAARELGVQGAVARLRALIEDALTTIPACPGREALQALLLDESGRFLPKHLAQRAA